MAKKTLLLLFALIPLCLPLCAEENVSSKKDASIAQETTLDKGSDQARDQSQDQIKDQPQKDKSPAQIQIEKESADDSSMYEEGEMPTPTPTTKMGNGTNYSKQFTGTLIAVLVVVFLVLLIIWLMRRFSNNRPLHMNHRKHIKILEKRPLSPNTYVYLVQIGDKQFCIAESKFQVSNVATLDWNETDPDR